MNGTILFTTAAALADFLAAFAATGSTATFAVQPKPNGFILTFTGGI